MCERLHTSLVVQKKGGSVGRSLPLFDDTASRCHRKPQKWDKMAKLNRRRRWRGPALGGPLQRGAPYCFAAFDGEATTAQLTEWCRPKIVHAGGKLDADVAVSNPAQPQRHTRHHHA
jgi:hypothetical protein